MRKRLLLIAVIAVCIAIGSGRAMAEDAATTEPTDAALLYLRAAGWITAFSPAASNFTYPDYPPFGPEWDRTEQAAWDANGPVRRIAHQARSSDQASWPARNVKVAYLNSCRALANDLGDAALYEHLHNNDAGASETIQDLLHLTKMLRQNPQRRNVIRPLVAGGIDALIANRVMIIDSGIRLTNDPNNTRDVQIGAARKLIDLVLDQQDPEGLIAQTAFSDTGAPLMDKSTTARLVETMRRVNAERTFAAISLACHIFQFENRRWPTRLDELVPNYLPAAPLDPWGNGKQTFGYAVIAGGLPDGSDRPLLYERCQLHDGLFYRTDQPEYGFYNMSEFKVQAVQRKQGGQFRDVARWAPEQNAKSEPTTRPLN